ncbi:hypothetical protein BAE44_0011749 [Dichanthelium oligosanthes]|uniref:Disease resistance protein RPM1 n=1 Tax=Dichanthelium oligosanthes TaxID=888268 RepID=A0A1E5VQ75_9POAL|nr:hypothetical protein BAE44_0011749 [Dichanthelium oligosanthes]
MKSVLSLGYFNLPHHLRTCLLYLSAFPEDCIIKRDRLISRWVAEGFVNAEPGESLYEAGLRYFNVLINRSLIQPCQEDNGVVPACRVHDVILNFLVSKSVEENFLTLLDPSGLPPSLGSKVKVRRLSLQNSYKENIVSWIKSIKPHVRSLACFVDCKDLHPLTEFEVVRVLDLENCGSLRNVHLSNIEMLLQLRYLSIRRTSVSELPHGIGQVQHLETLDIRNTEVEKLPSTIVQLENLVRLFVDLNVKFPAEGFSKMKGLEQLTLVNLRGQPLSFLKELGQLTNLRILEALWVILDDKYEVREWEIFTSSLCALGSHKLHSLDFDIIFTEVEIDIEITEELGVLVPTDTSFSVLKNLRTVMPFPIWMGSLVNLELLHLRTEQLTLEDLRVLGGMPALETLVVRIPRNTYKVPLTIHRHEFQRLKLFTIGKVYKLQFMPVSMPNLKRLHTTLHYGWDNTYRDLGIQHLASLTEVHICIIAWHNYRGSIGVLEARIRSLLDAHPNRPTLTFDTRFTTTSNIHYKAGNNE